MNILRTVAHWLDWLRVWTNQALWRSWLIHTLIAIPLASAVGPWPVILFFALRECEQLVHAFINHTLTATGRFEPWYDYPLDVAIPAVAVLWLT